MNGPMSSEYEGEEKKYFRTPINLQSPVEEKEMSLPSIQSKYNGMIV